MTTHENFGRETFPRLESNFFAKFFVTSALESWCAYHRTTNSQLGNQPSQDNLGFLDQTLSFYPHQKTVFGM